MKRIGRWLVRAGVGLLGIAIAWLVGAKILRRTLLRGPAPWIIGYVLDSGYRRALQPPDQVVTRSRIVPGQKVLELGCGSGAQTPYFARAVGPAGWVAAVDIEPRMLAQLANKLQRADHADINNVTLHEADATELPFEDDAFDRVVMVTVLPEIRDRDRALAEVRRVLKPDGLLAVSEFFPDPDYPLRSETIRWAKAAGFETRGVEGNLWTYTVRFGVAAPRGGLVE